MLPEWKEEFKMTGHGTETDPYLVETIAELQTAIDSSPYSYGTYYKNYIKFTKDINCNDDYPDGWNTVVLPASSKAGASIDFDDHCIIAPYVNDGQSFFEVADGLGAAVYEIKNLNVTNGFGGVVKRITYSATNNWQTRNLKFTNCSIDFTIENSLEPIFKSDFYKSTIKLKVNNALNTPVMHKDTIDGTIPFDTCDIILELKPLVPLFNAFFRDPEQSPLLSGCRLTGKMFSDANLPIYSEKKTILTSWDNINQGTTASKFVSSCVIDLDMSEHWPNGSGSLYHSGVNDAINLVSRRSLHGNWSVSAPNAVISSAEDILLPVKNIAAGFNVIPT